MEKQKWNEEKRVKSELLSEYPDIVTVDQLCMMLGNIGRRACYKLLHEGEIKYLKIGRGYRIPKQSVIEFIRRETK